MSRTRKAKPTIGIKPIDNSPIQYAGEMPTANEEDKIRAIGREVCREAAARSRKRAASHPVMSAARLMELITADALENRAKRIPITWSIVISALAASIALVVSSYLLTFIS